MRKFEELAYGCMAKAGQVEMTFVLLSRDRVAPATIRFWVSQRLAFGLNNASDAQILEALVCADTMEREGQSNKPVCAPSTDVMTGGRE